MKLCRTDYSQIVVDFEISGKRYQLSAFKSGVVLRLFLQCDGAPLYEPIVVPLVLIGDDTPPSRRFANLRPEDHELPLWNFLEQLPSLTVISLDRTITAEVEDRTYSDRTLRREPFEKSITPVEYVRTLTSKAYAAFRSKSILIDSDLKSKIVLSSLQSPTDERAQGGRPHRQLSDLDVAELEETVVGFLARTFGHQDVENQARNFFKHISQLSKSQSDHPGAFEDLVQAQYARIENLAGAFNEFENRNTSAFAPLRDYLDCVNQFLRDSGKELVFNESSGEIFFRYLLSTPGATPYKDINNLSSGEKQILFIFTLVSFAAREDSVFIVDEPELSLHPKWQHDFMEAFLKLCPDGTQLLFATHSPEIVGSRKSSCILVGE